MNLFPTQYSTLASSALNERIQQNYGIQAITTRFLLRNVSDTYLVLREEKPAHVFKVYRSVHRSPEEIAAEVELLNVLKGKGAKVAYPIADLEGNYIQEFNAVEGIRCGVLFTYADGKPSLDLSDEQLKTVGYEMAFNHDITSAVELKGPRLVYDVETAIHKPLEVLEAAFQQYDYREGFQRLKEIALQTADRMESFDTSSFSYGYCHYDYLPKNFHFDDRNKMTLFDFDFAGKGFLVNDLMTFQVHFFFHTLFGKITKNEADRQFRVFVDSYRQHRAISDEELAAIPTLGVMFWTFYLSVQYQGYNDFSNNYFGLNFLKQWVDRMEKWTKFYEK